MPALDTRIDELYRLPPGEFTGARNALAKTLERDEAKRIKALVKPTVVPWAVNQVYWRARSTYDRLMKSGEKLRTAQIAALEGRAADVRAASEAHRRAISEAVAEAERLAAPAGAKPGADALARTFEALSLANAAAETPGRLTAALQPAGFEALAGLGHLQLTTENSERKPRKLELAPKNGEPRTKNDERLAKAAAEAAAREAAEQKQHEAAVKRAEEALTRVASAERDARAAWEKAHDGLLEARRRLAEVRRSRFRSS